MSYDWGPNFIVPGEILRNFSGIVKLRESYDEDLLRKELVELGLPDVVVRVTNPWYYRRKGNDTWVKIGESEDRRENFPVTWDTRKVKNGKYEVLGLMHVFVKRGDAEGAIARQSVVEVSVEN